MDYGENRNETYVPMMNLQDVIGAKQIGGLLEYFTQQGKKIAGFSSCTINKTRSKSWNGGEWMPLFRGKRNAKDFTVESVGDSKHKVLRVSLCSWCFIYMVRSRGGSSPKLRGAIWRGGAKEIMKNKRTKIFRPLFNKILWFFC